MRFKNQSNTSEVVVDIKYLGIRFYKSGISHKVHEEKLKADAPVEDIAGNRTVYLMYRPGLFLKEGTLNGGPKKKFAGKFCMLGFFIQYLMLHFRVISA